MPVIPVLGEDHNFKASLDYIVRPCLNNNNKKIIIVIITFAVKGSK
jgi:hypothetical protein